MTEPPSQKTTDYVAAGTRTVVLTPTSDTEILVYSVKDQKGQRTLTTFKVSKETIVHNCGADGYFRKSILFNNKNGHATIELKDDNHLAIAAWLTYMHYEHSNGAVGCADPTDAEKQAKSAQQDAVFAKKKFVSVDIDTIWNIINVGDKYLFNGVILQGFFDRWYAAHSDMDAKGIDFARSLALPCLMFDHAQGFAAVTKWLAYNTAGHITEKRPKFFKWQHLHLAPPDFVGPMNHTRGGLKSCLHRGLWNRIKKLIDTAGEEDCTCFDAVIGQYFTSLVNINAYPLEDVFPKSSVNAICGRLAGFRMASVRTCETCDIPWKHVVERAIMYTKDNFDGLCLDCMESSKPKADKEYWKACGQSPMGRWDQDCRITHGQQTWYVSWCGRDEHRRKLLDERKGGLGARPLRFSSDE